MNDLVELFVEFLLALYGFVHTAFAALGARMFRLRQIPFMAISVDGA